MDVGVLAVRYAKALLDYALGEGVAEEVYSRMNVLGDCFAANPALSSTLEDPLLSRQEKLDLLSVASGDGKVKEVLENFFSLVIERRRENYLRSAALSYIDLYRKEKGIAVVRITTAVPLEKEMEEKILAKVSGMLGKRIELLKSVDPAIEGGFIFDIDDYRMDASVAAQLRRIRRSLLDKNRRIV